MIDHFFSQPKVLKRLHFGPLDSHIDSFAQILMVQGYKRNTAKHKIRIVADFSRWLDHQGLCVKDLDETTLNEYLLHKGRRGSIFKIEPPTLRALLKHLRETGVVADSVQIDDDSKLRRIESGFAQYLAQERGLKQVTIDNYLSIAGRFLSDQFGTGPIVLEGLQPSDIVRFILRNTETVSAKRVQLIVISLRSFFRFLYQREETANDLSPSALTVANWRLSELPRFLEPEQVERLLQSCNQDSLVAEPTFDAKVRVAKNDVLRCAKNWSQHCAVGCESDQANPTIPFSLMHAVVFLVETVLNICWLNMWPLPANNARPFKKSASRHMCSVTLRLWSCFNMGWILQ